MMQEAEEKLKEKIFTLRLQTVKPRQQDYFIGEPLTERRRSSYRLRNN